MTTTLAKDIAAEAMNLHNPGVSQMWCPAVKEMRCGRLAATYGGTFRFLEFLRDAVVQVLRQGDGWHSWRSDLPGCERGLHGRERGQAIHPGLRPVARHVVIDQRAGLDLGLGMTFSVLRLIDHFKQAAGDRDGVFDVVAAEAGAGLSAAGAEKQTEGQPEGEGHSGEGLQQACQGGEHRSTL